jgi:hypothetical protein
MERSYLTVDENKRVNELRTKQLNGFKSEDIQREISTIIRNGLLRLRNHTKNAHIKA